MLRVSHNTVKKYREGVESTGEIPQFKKEKVLMVKKYREELEKSGEIRHLDKLEGNN